MPNTRIRPMKSLPVCDLKTAAFLVARGHRVLSVTRAGRRMYFHFADSDSVQEDVDNFQFADASICGRELFASFERLKDVVFSKSAR